MFHLNLIFQLTVTLVNGMLNKLVLSHQSESQEEENKCH